MPSSLMETLDAAAIGRERYQITPAEINLILRAERWLLDNGWDIHWFRGWNSDEVSFAADPDGGLVVRRRQHKLWGTEGELHPVRSVVAGLNILVNEEILPARFSTHGMKALADYAKALDRAADATDEQAQHDAMHDPAESLLDEARAETFRRAAEVARQHNPIAVLS